MRVLSARGGPAVGCKLGRHPAQLEPGSGSLKTGRHLSRQRKVVPRRQGQRALVCFALALHLLLWPGLSLLSRHVLGFALEALNAPVGFYSYEANLFRSVLVQADRARRRDTMADRASATAHVRVNPTKFVGYVGETINFNALATDQLGRTVQGVKFNWEESDRASKLQMDDTGRATFLRPGLARITCRAGSIVANAVVLIRPNQRPVQSDTDWRADQANLGSVTIGSRQPETSIFSSLLDSINPTAYAQSGPYTGNDFAYDQLWTEPRNLVGSPGNRVLESAALGAVLPESSNFNLAVPLLGLQGRGIASSLTLYGNSRVWGRHGNAVTFDPVASWPSPGFSLGFGRIVTYDVNYYMGTGKLLLVEPDGTRRYLGSTNGFCACQANDGSHIKYSGGLNGGNLFRADGTVTYFSNVNNRLLPTSITDRNGNVIHVAYRSAVDEYGNPTGYSPFDIDYVTDTLGRVIQFNYDASGHLIKITAPGYGGTAQNPVTQTLVQLDYETRALGYNFGGLTVENTGSGSFDALKHVYVPATGTGYLFSYSSYGMVYNYSVRRQMSLGTWPPDTILDGVESSNVSLDYPTSAGTVLTDAPAFSQRTETAVNSPTSVYNYSSSTDSGAQTMTFTITRPDATTVQLTRSTNTSSIANGRLVRSELKSGTASFAKSVLTYANDPAGSPQVQSVTSYDDTSTPLKLDFDYDSYGNITNKREYGYQISGAWQVRRRTHFTYRAANLGGNSWMSGLPTLIEVFDAAQNTNDADDILIAKSSYEYDNYAAMSGMEDYGGTAAPPGHLTYAYNASYTDRGNVTGSTQWTDISTGSTIQRLAKYDIFGNTVKAQVSCCQEKDVALSNDTYFSLADSEMSGNPAGVHQITSTDYDFNTSLPASATDAGGLVATFGYDAALNPSSVVLPTGAGAATAYNHSSLSSSSSVSYDDNGTYKSITTTAQYDGWGRQIQSVDRNNGQVNTGYDAMRRAVSRTNSFTAGGNPGPATTFQFDPLGRVTITTLPGGNTLQNIYTGSTATAIDQVGRKIKRETDGLGRLIKITEQDVSSGALTQETIYAYNLLDKLTGVNQGGQTRSYKFDALGRLLFERIPEQSATINDGAGAMWSSKYTYTEFNAVATRKDARGVVTSYAYDALHRISGIGYDTSGATGVAATSPVSFGYNSWGAVSNITMNDYTEDYTFDGYHRPASVSRWILGQTYDIRKTYTTGFAYNDGSQVTQMSYPSGSVIDTSYDARGRLSAKSGAMSGLNYNVAGQATGLTLGNLVSEAFGYDSQRMQLTNQAATKSGGPTGGLINLSYNYQASVGQMGAGASAGNAGQLTAITGTISGLTESAAYTYDNSSRLTTSNQTSNSATAQRRFAYDRWGNRTGVWDATSGGNQIQSIALEQSAGAPTNRLQSVSAAGGAAPVAYWKLDETGGTTASDSSGNGNTGALENGPAWTSGRINNAVNLDGVNDDVLVATSSSLNPSSALSVAAWFKTTSTGGYQFLINKFNHNSGTTSDDSYTLGLAPNGNLYWQVQTSAGSYVMTPAPAASILDGQFHHIAATYDGAQMKVYLDGGLVSSMNANGTIVASSSPILLGASLNNGTKAFFHHGVLDEASIYNQALSATNVLALSQASPPPVSYTYDLVGNVTWDGAHSYSYDAENRLVSVDGGTTAQYKYDYQNRRVSKSVGSSWTHYIWQGSQVIAEHDATTAYGNYGDPPYQLRSARVDYIYAENRMISSKERASAEGAWTTKYYLSDRLSTRVVLDASGNVIGRQAHLPFGEDFAESGSQGKHHFTTYERSSEAGTDYAVNRQYSQITGRFTRVDPLKGNLFKPQRLNLYSYVLNNPINAIDRKGLDGEDDEPDPSPAPIPPSFDPLPYDFFAIVLDRGDRSELGGPKTPMPFSEETLKKCLDTLFGVIMTSFQKAENGRNGSFTGTGPDSITHSGNNANIQVTIAAGLTGRELGVMWTARHPGNPVDELRGVHFHDLAYFSYVASDLDAFSKKPSIAVQVHELGNALAYITGTASNPTTPNPENSDTDSGVRLERCVFGGTYKNNGGFVPAPPAP